MSVPSTPTRGLRRKFHSFNKNRVFRVIIIGQKGVGKSALTVRFLTRRFIGEYDPTLEKMYTCTRYVLGNCVEFEIMDTAGEYENSKLKEHMKWCHAVILMYSVTDRCSFNEARRLNFVVTASSRRRFKASSDPSQDYPLLSNVPVTLVANQADRDLDRMVSSQEGRQLASELSCISFAEISVREDIEAVMEVFEDLYAFHRKAHKARLPLWALISLERLNFGHSSRDSDEEVNGDSGLDKEGFKVETSLSPALKARRREALVS